VLKDIRSNLQVELDGQIELRRQLAAEEPYIPGATEVAGEMSLGGTSSDQSIRDLEAQRSQLLLAYTERHPDVVAITEQLAQLYKKREEERTALESKALQMQTTLYTRVCKLRSMNAVCASPRYAASSRSNREWSPS